MRAAQRMNADAVNWYCKACGADNGQAYFPPKKCLYCKAEKQWSMEPPKVAKKLTFTEALSKEAKAKETDWNQLYLCFEQWLMQNPKEVILDEGDCLFCNVGGGAKEIRSAAKNDNPYKAALIKIPKSGSFTHLGMLVATIYHDGGTNLFIGVAANAFLVWDKEESSSRWQWQVSKVSDDSLNVCHTEQLCLCALHTYLGTLSGVKSLRLAWLTEKELCGWCQYAEGAFATYWFKTKGVSVEESSYKLLKK